jgi:hypothetical protein
MATSYLIRTMDKVRKPNISVYLILSSLFVIYVCIVLKLNHIHLEFTDKLTHKW